VDEASTVIHPSEKARPARGLKGFAKSLLLGAFSGLREGYLELRDGNEVFRFGDEASQLRAEGRIRDPRAYSLGAFRGEVGLGEAYMQGYWTSPDPVAVVRLAVRNMAAFDQSGGIRGGPGKLEAPPRAPWGAHDHPRSNNTHWAVMHPWA